MRLFIVRSSAIAPANFPDAGSYRTCRAFLNYAYNYCMYLCIRDIVCVNVCMRVLHGFVKHAHQRNLVWRTDHRKAFPSVSRAAVITLSMTVSQR